ncbi:aromatic motif membrane protein [Mycoplasma sp. Ms02]|uniref:aromatic motif membrane protein n=1 Tax=Mycoplasma sp. Ms02 TaxID=353851 RepID=UPI001C8AC2D6|nr:aromatic motif membrane protein [Mycoplasma sp. Ms02]QZE12545.1 hypothetical protein K4L35_00955 [Mycoplasma sp. Ms02]
MKKYLKVTSVLLALSPAFAFVSCANAQETKQEVKFKKNEKVEHFLFEKLEYDQKQKTDYLNLLKQFDSTIKTELEISLIWFPMFKTDTNENIDVRKSFYDAKKFINKTLSENWYWYLQNLNNLKFVLTSYGDNYSQNGYDEIYKNQNAWVLNQKIDLDLNNYIEIPVALRQSSNNELQSLKAIYLKDKKNNIALKLYLYNFNNKTQILIYPELFSFEGQDFATFAQNLESETKKQWEQAFTKEQEYQESLGSYTEESRELLDKTFSDTNFLKFLNGNSATQATFAAVEALNANSETKIHRYRLVGINE